jgi:hypothetical protein
MRYYTETAMKRFEYDISLHPFEEFNRVAYFCTEKGECSINDLPDNQVKALGGVLRARGDDGWELVQIIFGNDGAVAFWKRESL